MKNTKLVSKNKIKTVNNTPALEEEVIFELPIYGIDEDDEWVKRLKKYNPAAYEKLKNWE